MDSLEPASRQPPREGAAFGRYRIERRLGMGGMGVVYAARDTVLDRLVALKVIAGQLAGDDAFRRRFQHEAGILARLDSPHVIAIFDHGEHEGVPFIATQYVPGGDVGAWVEAHGPMPPAVALAVTGQVAEALGDAHRAGVVHRDVKAGNVLLRSAQLVGPDADVPHAYLCDFGIALADTGGTHTSSAAGSWAYLSPERLRGAPATRSSDLYAVGCLLWTCLTGAPPYTGADAEVAIAHLNEPVPRLATGQTGGDDGDDGAVFAAGLDALLARLLAKSPEDRVDDAGELRRALRELGDPPPGFRPARAAPAPREVTRLRGGETPTPTPVAPAGPEPARPAETPRTRRPGRLVVAGAVAAVLVVAALTAAGLGRLGPGSSSSEGDPGPAAPAGPTALVTGDGDGDGLGDLALAWLDFSLDDPEPAETWLLPSDGADGFGEPVRTVATPGAVEALSDVDGDGALDRIAAFGDDEEDEVVVVAELTDGGTSKLGLPRVGPLARSLSEPMAVGGDFDGDGYGDVLLRPSATEQGTALVVVRGGPNGLVDPGPEPLRPWVASEIGLGLFHPIRSGDLDGDGDDDLLVTLSGLAPVNRVQVLLSEDGAFEPAEEVFELDRGGLGGWDAQAVPADVDGDGTEEVLTYLPTDDGFEVQVRDVVDGTIGEPTIWATETHRVDETTQTQPYVSDVDGDGDDDLVLLRNRELFTGDQPDRAFAVDVLVADDGAFLPAARWAELPCQTPACDDNLVVK